MKRLENGNIQDPKGTQYWRNRVMKVAQDFDNLNTAVANSGQFGGMINSELNGAGWDMSKPHIVIFDEADKKYIMEEEFTSDGKTFAAFVKSYFAGEVEAFVKSEAVPESQGALKKVTIRTPHPAVGLNDCVGCWQELGRNCDE